MQGLTDQQTIFVDRYVSNGGNGTAAARDGGYSRARASQYAWELLQKPHVLEAVHAKQARMIGGELATKAVEVIQGILNDAELPKTVAGRKLQFEASKTVLDRAGHIAPKAAEPVETKDEKPMSEWTVEELEAFIRRGEATMEESAREREALEAAE
jgi:phage terminase small subunit